VSELAATVREALRALAASDPSLKRFGAAHHRYELAPPAPQRTALFYPDPGPMPEISADTPPGLASMIEGAHAGPPRPVPEDLETFTRTIGASGAGPGYGFLGIRKPVNSGGVPWDHSLPIAHLGCGYAAVIPLGPRELRGQVWLDARAVGVVRPLAATFTAFYLEWIERLANNAWPEAPVGPGSCPLPNALGGFLGVHEKRLGRQPGSLAGEELRTALSQLGSQSIEIAAESSALFPDGTRVDPCIACARLVEALAADGLAPDVVARGV
jgi:hypothetical protein